MELRNLRNENKNRKLFTVLMLNGIEFPSPLSLSASKQKDFVPVERFCSKNISLNLFGDEFEAQEKDKLK